MNKIDPSINPAVLHETNNEPWYQSRVTLGAITGIGSGIGVVLVAWDENGFLAQAWPGITAIVGGAFTLYGRWAARKPLGAPK